MQFFLDEGISGRGSVQFVVFLGGLGGFNPGTEN